MRKATGARRPCAAGVAHTAPRPGSPSASDRLGRRVRRSSGSPSRSPGSPLLALLVLAIEPLRDRGRRRDPGRHRGAARRAARPRLRRRADRARARPRPRRRLVSGRDPRRGGRLRLRLLGRRCALVMVGWLLNAHRRLLDRPPRRSAAALPGRRPRSASSASSGWPSAAGVTLLLGDAADPDRARSASSRSSPARPGCPCRALPVDDRRRLPPDHGRCSSTSAAGSRSSRRPTRSSGSARSVLLALLLLTRRVRRSSASGAAAPQRRPLGDRRLDLVAALGVSISSRWPPGPETTTAGSAGSSSSAASIASSRTSSSASPESKSSSHCVDLELRHGLGDLAQQSARRRRGWSPAPGCGRRCRGTATGAPARPAASAAIAASVVSLGASEKWRNSNRARSVRA